MHHNILAIHNTLDERIQPQLCVRHQRIPSNNSDASLRLFVYIEVLRVVRARSIKHPESHHASTDCKARHESPFRLTSKHFARIPRNCTSDFIEPSSPGFCLCSPITSTLDQSYSPSGKAASAGVRKMSSLRAASEPVNALFTDV